MSGNQTSLLYFYLRLFSKSQLKSVAFYNFLVSEAQTVPWIQELTGYCLPVTTNDINNQAKEEIFGIKPCFACPTSMENATELNSNNNVFVLYRVNPKKTAQTWC